MLLLLGMLIENIIDLYSKYSIIVRSNSDTLVYPVIFKCLVIHLGIRVSRELRKLNNAALGAFIHEEGHFSVF